MRRRWCERSASSSASSRGRLRSASQGGRWAIRAAARLGASSPTHAAGFSRSHACTQRKAIEEVILSSCGGSNISNKRENESSGQRSFFRFRLSTPSIGSAAAAMSERAPEAGAPRGTPSRGRRARSRERKRPAAAAAPGCATVSQRARVVSVEAVDLVVEGREGLLLDGLHGDLVPAAAQLREGRPVLAALLQHLLVLEMPDVGHRLLGHALDLALLLARAVGLDREDAVHLGAQAEDPGWEGLVAELAQLPHHLDGLGARRCRERAQVPLGVFGLAGHVEEGGAASPRPCAAGPAARRSAPSRCRCP